MKQASRKHPKIPTENEMPAGDETLPPIPPDQSLPEARRREIAAALKHGAQSHFVSLPGGYRAVPLARLRDTLLLYRVDNGRVLADLREGEREGAGNGGSARQRWTLADLRASPEARETQTILHRLLLEKARDPRGPIYDELARSAIQTEPLLVTGEGIVINGNRRLAAMRTLRQLDPQRFASFAEIQAAVIPDDVTPSDLEFAEAALQMAPETKLGYGWIDRRLKMRRQRDDLGLPASWIVQAYRLSDEADAAREIAQLELAENYLADFMNKPGRYSLLAEIEHLLCALLDQLCVLPETTRRLWQNFGFAMIAARSSLDAGFERHFPFADPVPKNIPVWSLQVMAASQGSADTGLEIASGALGGVLSQSSETALAALAADARENVSIAQELAMTLASLRALHGERQAPQRMLHRMREARQMMDRLDPERLNREQKSRLRGDVAAIHAQAAYLLGEDSETRFEQRKTGLLKAFNQWAKRFYRR